MSEVRLIPMEMLEGQPEPLGDLSMIEAWENGITAEEYRAANDESLHDTNSAQRFFDKLDAALSTPEEDG